LYKDLEASRESKIELRLVEDLFNQWHVLWLSGIAQASIATIAYERTGKVFFVGWGLASALVLLFRVAVNIAFDRRGDGPIRIDVWRSLFLLGTWANGSLAGLSGAYAVLYADGFTQLLVIVQSACFVMGSAARNCLHPRAAAGSVLIAVGTLDAGCLATGDIYYQLLAPFIALYMIAALSLTRHLYAQTLNALLVNEEKATLLCRLETSNVDLAAANAKLEYAAHHDKLTGLANRAFFMQRMELAVERVRSGTQRLFAVLFLDFDRFKLTNDTLGHDAGDELLRLIADRLRSELRASDLISDAPTSNVVSRFGGDEFLLLINDLDEPQMAARIAERLLNALRPAYEIQGTEVYSSASIGIVTSDQCPGSAEDAVRNADVAMFEAKRAGRACSVVFNESMHIRLTRHVTIENSLRRAIGSPQIHLLYQPIVDLQSGRMVSAEALVRWRHPELGMIGPAEFIPIAEDSNLIIALGQWVQREACETMVRWMVEDPQGAPDSISVNVSRAELALGHRLVEQIGNMLERVGLPAKRLQIEVTEREVMRDPSGARTVLLELQRLGVRLAMDDFGTGTSSLSLLRDYPFDAIKIDRSFVEGLSSRSDVLAVIHATVTLVENLGMVSVAEGVEEDAQVAILQSMGCRYAQGYLFSAPLPAEELLGALERSAQA